MSWQTIISHKLIDNTVEEWIIALAIFMICAISSYAIYYFLLKLLKKFTNKTKTKNDDFLPVIFYDIKNSLVLLFSIYFALRFITLTDNANNIINKIILIFLTLRISFFFQTFLIGKIQKSILNYLDPILRNRIKPILGKILSAFIWVIALFLIVSNLGYNLTSLIAGLGVGGIFIGLAAQETLSNFFSSMSLFLDQPFNIGEVVTINNVTGTIEEFGMRSTRIRTFEGTMVVIPNNKIAQEMITNISKRESRRTDLKIGITYDTSTDKIKEAVQIIKDTITSNSYTQKKARVHFTTFGDSALFIEAVYYVNLLESFDKVQNVRQDINLRIKSLFEKAGIEFAYPTQTVFVHNS